jgi:hypothetical protein
MNNGARMGTLPRLQRQCRYEFLQSSQCQLPSQDLGTLKLASKDSFGEIIGSLMVQGNETGFSCSTSLRVVILSPSMTMVLYS